LQEKEIELLEQRETKEYKVEAVNERKVEMMIK
jgi:hypothetical protein